MLRLHRVVLVACIGIGLTTGAVIKPAAAAPATPVTSSATYTVRAGDYLSGIAMKLNVSLKDLLKVNGMTTASLIVPGMQLQVPGRTTSTAGVPAKTTAAAPMETKSIVMPFASAASPQAAAARAAHNARASTDV